MRLLALMFSTSLLVLAPGFAPAQQRVAPVVDLDTVETTADAIADLIHRAISAS